MKIVGAVFLPGEKKEILWWCNQHEGSNPSSHNKEKL
jgi:hypothetical protein